MSKIKALLTGILNIILFIPRRIYAGSKLLLKDMLCLFIAITSSIMNSWHRFWSIFKSSPNFLKVVPQKHETYKNPSEVLLEECEKTSPGGSKIFGGAYRKSDKAIEALAEVMCPHGEFGCGKIECNVFRRDRISNFEIKKEQLKREYTMNTFHKHHRWRLEFGTKEDDTMLLWARSAKIIKKPTFFKKGIVEVTFYSKPEVIDYLARKPKAKAARLTFTQADGSLMSYIELKKFKLHEVDLTSLDFDYTDIEITTVKAYFSFSKFKFFGTVTTNGPMEKAVV